MKAKIIFTSVLISFLISSCGTDESSQLTRKNEKIKIQTVKAKMKYRSNKFEYSGVAEPFKKTSLGFSIPGSVHEIKVDIGDMVSAGATLAILDKTTMQNSYDASLAMLEQAEDAHERLRKVHENGSLPDIKWEEVVSKLQQAKSTSNIAKENLDDCLLKAPVAGVIGSRNIEIGSNAAPGIPVFELVDINRIYVKVSVPENEISRISTRDKANISIPAAGIDNATGIVDKIGVMASPVSKTYEVKIVVDNPGHKIKPGMACDVNLETSASDMALTIPYKAVLKDENNDKYIYMVDTKTNKIIRQDIKTGIFCNNDIEVKSGLSEGDQVLIDGQDKLNGKTEISL